MYQRNFGFFQAIPPVTKNLIIINVLCWLAAISLSKINIDLYNILGLHFPIGGNFYPHQFVTYMFMHDQSSISHLFFNMFSLFMFGRALETIWGPKRFITYYFIRLFGLLNFHTCNIYVLKTGAIIYCPLKYLSLSKMATTYQ